MAINWNAASAIGSILGAIATFIACCLALRKPPRILIEIVEFHDIQRTQKLLWQVLDISKRHYLYNDTKYNFECRIRNPGYTPAVIHKIDIVTYKNAFYRILKVKKIFLTSESTRLHSFTLDYTEYGTKYIDTGGVINVFSNIDIDDLRKSKFKNLISKG